jgi:hypothetical protein
VIALAFVAGLIGGLLVWREIAKAVEQPSEQEVSRPIDRVIGWMGVAIVAAIIGGWL